MTTTPAYQEGYAAYRQHRGNGKFSEETHGSLNPYSPNSSDYYDWIQGWNNRGWEDADDECYQESYGY